ncbi:hypothetical protein GMMP15_810003 [Candidatus Magnetomoraceae bacterium gMMP-15]
MQQVQVCPFQGPDLYSSTDEELNAVSVQVNSDRVKNLYSKFLSNATEKINYEVYVEHFQKEVKKITDILSRIFIFAENLNDDQTLSYLHSCISTKNHDVKCPELGDSHLKIISISGFPQESYPQIFQELNQAVCEQTFFRRNFL